MRFSPRLKDDWGDGGGHVSTRYYSLDNDRLHKAQQSRHGEIKFLLFLRRARMR